MKTTMVTARGTRLALMAAFLCSILAMNIGCGSTDTSAEDRLISGSIDTSVDSDLSKSFLFSQKKRLLRIEWRIFASVRAMNANGEEVDGLIYRESSRWEVRLRAGQWIIAFYENDGELAGHFELNGMMAFQIEDGDDIDVGRVRFLNRRGMRTEDLEDLAEIRQSRSAFGADSDFDGIPDLLDQNILGELLDVSIFQVISIRPFDGASYVAPCRPVKIYFSAPIDETTLNATSVSVLEDGIPVDGILSYEVVEEESFDGEAVTEYVVKFTPDSNYPLGSALDIIILGGVDGLLSSTGEQLPASYDFSFTVRDFGEMGSQCYD